MKLKKHCKFTGTLTCKTGMHVGGSEEGIEIGGLDMPIIREPVRGLPYIPGSSLKGKVRSLLEYKYGLVDQKGSPHGQFCQDDHCLVCRVFGPHFRQRHNYGPSRMLMRDAHLSSVSEAELREHGENVLRFAGVKTENMIDRVTGKAQHPRSVEFVPKGTKFDFNMSLRIFDTDDEKEIIAFVDEGLNLLQDDALGGSGSRGYGWVELDYKIVS